MSGKKSKEKSIIGQANDCWVYGEKVILYFDDEKIAEEMFHAIYRIMRDKHREMHE